MFLNISILIIKILMHLIQNLMIIILNCLMACKLYYKPNTKEELQEVELVTLNNDKKESNLFFVGTLS